MYIVLICGSRSCIHNTYKQLAGNTAKVMVGKENFVSGKCSMVEACRADLCSDQYTSHKIVSLQWTFGREVSAVRAGWRVFRQNSLRPGSEDPPLNPPANKVPGQWRPFNNTWPLARPYNTETHSTSIQCNFYNTRPESIHPNVTVYVIVSFSYFVVCLG